MANPRKFSEKIALHNHRQAEETAAFEQIMKEVIEVTTKEDTPHGTRTLPGSSLTSSPSSSAAMAAAAYRGEGRSRARSQGGPIRRPHDRKLDTSPYSSTSYLSPPVDTGWRRTNSDSALHQSTMQGLIDRNNDASNRGWNMPMMNGPDRNLDGRPRSSCDIPSSRVPGISIHHSPHDPSMIQIPIANTGSLPDLTNVDFASPIHAPLDQEHSSSPYSSNVQLDKNVNLVDADFSQIQGLLYQQQCSPTSTSPTLQQRQQPHHQQQQHHRCGGVAGATTYRSSRPSPQSSPSPGGGGGGGSGGRHSAPCSPAGGTSSPLPHQHPHSPNDYHALSQQAAQFQQHFEQLSMLDPPPNPLPPYTSPDHHSTSAGGVSTPPMSQQQQQQHHQQLHTTQACMPTDATTLDMGSDTGYYSTSPSQLVYSASSPGLQSTAPNTPTIILTDFSVTEDDMLRQDSLSGQLASEFFSDETLKEGLGSLDFDEFQILSNPSMSIPETVEDNFRLDHRS